jgi:hypothetical protein
MKQGFWRLKVTAGIGNNKDRPIWHAQQILSANPVSTMLVKANSSLTNQRKL